MHLTFHDEHGVGCRACLFIHVHDLDAHFLDGTAQVGTRSCQTETQSEDIFSGKGAFKENPT